MHSAFSAFSAVKKQFSAFSAFSAVKVFSQLSATLCGCRRLSLIVTWALHS
jgi:hypothetical protein